MPRIIPGGNSRYYKELKQAFFSIMRTVDIDSINDKLGTLTNFGLRVLYNDAIQKTNEKRLLIGEALLDINSKLLQLVGLDNDPGVIVWPDVLPANEQEEIQVISQEIGLGIVSKETAATERGRDWKDEQEKIAAEKVSDSDIGTAILDQFLARG